MSNKKLELPLTIIPVENGYLFAVTDMATNEQKKYVAKTVDEAQTILGELLTGDDSGPATNPF